MPLCPFKLVVILDPSKSSGLIHPFHDPRSFCFSNYDSSLAAKNSFGYNIALVPKTPAFDFVLDDFLPFGAVFVYYSIPIPLHMKLFWP